MQYTDAQLKAHKAAQAADREAKRAKRIAANQAARAAKFELADKLNDEKDLDAILRENRANYKPTNKNRRRR